MMPLVKRGQWRQCGKSAQTRGPGSKGVLGGRRRSEPLTGHQNVDLKLTECQIFLQQGWVYAGVTENCRSDSATLVRNVQVSSEQGKENTFIDRKGSWES